MTRRRLIAVLLPLLASAGAGAADYRLGDLRIESPYAFSRPVGAREGAVYFVIVNSTATADRLIGVSSPASDIIELHTTVRDGSVLRMREVQSVEIPARGRIELRPGGLHVMVMGLDRPLTLGTTLPLTLRFEKSGTIDIQVEIRPVRGSGG
jgi:copper(I)-binding protein